jgi:hypothetical protein
VNSVLDQAHDPALTSGGETAKLSDPELPFGRFRCTDDARWRIGVLVGDRILDLQRAKFIQSNDMIALMQAGTTSRKPQDEKPAHASPTDAKRSHRSARLRRVTFRVTQKVPPR